MTQIGLSLLVYLETRMYTLVDSVNSSSFARKDDLQHALGCGMLLLPVLHYLALEPISQCRFQLVITLICQLSSSSNIHLPIVIHFFFAMTRIWGMPVIWSVIPHSDWTNLSADVS